MRERFTGAPERDNDGFRILPGVEFGQHALITGKAQVGYRKLNTIAAGMPDFSGLVAAGELAYALRGATRFTVGVSRDVLFSYSTTEPFYIQTGYTASVTQQVSGPWDVQARARVVSPGLPARGRCRERPVRRPRRPLPHLRRRHRLPAWQGRPGGV